MRQRFLNMFKWNKKPGKYNQFLYFPTCPGQSGRALWCTVPLFCRSQYYMGPCTNLSVFLDLHSSALNKKIPELELKQKSGWPGRDSIVTCWDGKITKTVKLIIKHHKKKGNCSLWTHSESDPQSIRLNGLWNRLPEGTGCIMASFSTQDNFRDSSDQADPDLGPQEGFSYFMLHTQWYDSTQPTHVPKVSSAPLGSSCSPLVHPLTQPGPMRSAASFGLVEALREHRGKREGIIPKKRQRQSVYEGDKWVLRSSWEPSLVTGLHSCLQPSSGFCRVQTGTKSKRLSYTGFGFSVTRPAFKKNIKMKDGERFVLSGGRARARSLQQGIGHHC